MYSRAMHHSALSRMPHIVSPPMPAMTIVSTSDESQPSSPSHSRSDITSSAPMLSAVRFALLGGSALISAAMSLPEYPR